MPGSTKKEVHKLSKIYNQNYTGNETFGNVDSAKRFFITDQAIQTFNKYCHRQECQLTNENRSLHWTIIFELDQQPIDGQYVPPSSLWRDKKITMTENKEWFADGNWPVIEHEAKHLF